MYYTPSSEELKSTLDRVKQYKLDRENEEIQQAREQRNKDLAEGRARGEKEFAERSLGRVDESRSQAIKDILARRQTESNGFSPEEQQAFREKNQVDINQALAGKLRALRSSQAQAGVRGGLATAQQASAIKDANNANVTNERELFLKNIDARRQGLSNYEGLLTGTEKNELERKMYNQGQLNKEKLGRLGTEFGYGSLGASDRASLYQKWGSEEMAQATRDSANKGGVCCFIFLEARYGNGSMDKVVRRFRNEKMTAQNRRGYYKLSEVLVPLMRKSRVAKIATRLFLTDPLVAYGKAYYGEGSKLGFIFAPVKNFWLNLFDYLGGDHPFIRENGEVI